MAERSYCTCFSPLVYLLAPLLVPILMPYLMGLWFKAKKWRHDKLGIEIVEVQTSGDDLGILLYKHR